MNTLSGSTLSGLKYSGVSQPRIIEVVANGVLGGNDTFDLVFSRPPVPGELIIISAFGRNNSIASVTGFTTLLSINSGTGRQRVFYKEAGGAESATYTVNFSSTTNVKEAIGLLVADYNTGSIFGTGDSWQTTDASPLNMVNTTLAVSAGSLVLFGTSIISSFSGSNSFSGVEHSEIYLPGGLRTALSYRRIIAPVAAIQCVWSWGAAGANDKNMFTIVLNPKT
jgi:hypothetical protein